MTPGFGTKSGYLLAGILTAFCAAAAHAQAQAPDVPRRVIIVSGEGEAAATPDRARLTAGVVTQAPTAAAALDANTRAMNAVFEALRRLNIPDNKIRTANFSIFPEYSQPRPGTPQPQVINSYRVSNQVTVIQDDVAKTGETLDALIRSGANQATGISFEIADPKPLMERARRAAVADAAAKARTLADAAGITLGPIISLQENGASEPRPMPFARALAAEAAPPPIAAGEQTVNASVTMTYAIQ
jgi:uncharacterized protein YggE